MKLIAFNLYIFLLYSQLTYSDTKNRICNAALTKQGDTVFSLRVAQLNDSFFKTDNQRLMFSRLPLWAKEEYVNYIYNNTDQVILGSNDFRALIDVKKCR